MERTLPPCRSRARRLAGAVASALLAGLAAAPAQACATALILAIDVSGSIDRGEYRLQTAGLAAALSDPAVRDAMVQGQVALSIVQWSSAWQQQVMLPWTRIATRADVDRVAATAARLPRAFERSDTAPGELVAFALPLFDQVPDCPHRVIDISGDGPQNAGKAVGWVRAEAHRAGVIINGIAIEDVGRSLAITEYYRRNVITPTGFVMTARGLADYAPTLRRKLLRELAPTLG